MIEQKSTRVVIVSEQAVYLRGLQALVMAQPNLDLVGEARTTVEILQLCRLAAPGMILMDTYRGLEKWQDAITAVRKQWPLIQIVVLLELEDEERAGEEFAQQPVYRISRDVNEAEFRAALDQILQDGQRHSGMGRGRFQHNVEAEVESEAQEELELMELGQGGARPRAEGLMAREMVMAGRIQADILPEEPPCLPGWDIAARLVPARETSGDFYDFIPLSDRKLGIVVADVTDKGMGAALFMALSSSLIRTYAGRYPTLPAIAMSAVSERILSDTRGSMFVTAFYGILEPHTGRLVFANAGHPPGCLISTRRGKESIDHLRPTGMALGVTEEAHWRQKEVRMNPGDVLVLYTDGITEAQNPEEIFFEEDRMIEAVLRRKCETAQQILDGLLSEVQHFVGSAARQDDIAILVIRRE